MEKRQHLRGHDNVELPSVHLMLQIQMGEAMVAKLSLSSGCTSSPSHRRGLSSNHAKRVTHGNLSRQLPLRSGQIFD